MNWSQQPATEGRLGSAEVSEPLPPLYPSAPSQPGQRDEITVGKTTVLAADGQPVEAFTMTLGGETITLLPLRNWSQQDVHKWRARGKLPNTPAGLEITFEHVKVAGERVVMKEPDSAAKLQKILNEWLTFERRSVQLAQQKAQPKQAPAEQGSAGGAANLIPQFRVEVDKDGQVHIRYVQGKETLSTIGLNLPGLTGFVNQGLMHKPRSIQVGALHDWVELDGEFFSFEKGKNDAAKLEKALNERYLSTAAFGQGKEVVVFTNAASPTGFDIQFAAKVGGVTENRRRPLNDEALGLLQAPEKCAVLPKDLVIKLSPPNLIFKRKTPDGGETYLAPVPEHAVTVTGEDGEVKRIDLSRPVNYSRLTALDLTAMFNHPAVNQHATLGPQPVGAPERPAPAQAAAPAARESAPAPTAAAQQATMGTRPAEVSVPQPEPAPPKEPPKPVVLKLAGDGPTARSAPAVRPRPNLWLEPILAHPAARPDWFAFLLYSKMAEHFGNSAEGYFGPHPCWASALGEVQDICGPGFHGVFLTQKGGLGYLNQGHLARFRNEVAFLGTLESMIEGIGVKVIAVGVDSQQCIVFIVSEGYRGQFGLPEPTVVQELARLRQHGACLLSPSEVLQSPEPLELVWTVPAPGDDATEPQAAESVRPASAA